MIKEFNIGEIYTRNQGAFTSKVISVDLQKFEVEYDSYCVESKNTTRMKLSFEDFKRVHSEVNKFKVEYIGKWIESKEINSTIYYRIIHHHKANKCPTSLNGLYESKEEFLKVASAVSEKEVLEEDFHFIKLIPEITVKPIGEN